LAAVETDDVGPPPEPEDALPEVDTWVSGLVGEPGLFRRGGELPTVPVDQAVQ
jgi:hypothetical protein